MEYWVRFRREVIGIAGSLARIAMLDWRGFCFLPIPDMSWRRRTDISEDRVVSSLMAALPTVRSDLTTTDRSHFSARSEREVMDAGRPLDIL